MAVDQDRDFVVDLLACGANPFTKYRRYGDVAGEVDAVRAAKELCKEGSPLPDCLPALLIFETQESAAMTLLLYWNRLRRREQQQEEPDITLGDLPRVIIRVIFNKAKFANDHCIDVC